LTASPRHKDFETGLVAGGAAHVSILRTPLHPENAVWKRWLVGFVIVVTCSLAVAWLFPATLYVSLGTLRREAFFDGKPTSYWVRAVKHERFLGHAPPGGDIGKALRGGGAAAVPVLRAMTTDPDESVRSEALRVLTFLGPDAKAATPELSATMKEEDNGGRFMLASEALAHADPAAAAETLGAVLRDKTNDGRRAWALTELLKLSPKGQEALPALKEMVNNPEVDILLRVQAIRMLWRLHEPAEPLLQILKEVVTANRSPAGVQALEALGEMGSSAMPALPTLLELLKDPSIPLTGNYWGPPQRAAVIHAIGSIGPEARSAIPALLVFLTTNNYIIRMEVAIALANMGPSAEETLAARDAVSWASITLLAANPAGNLSTAPLVQIAVRTWIPREEKTVQAIREAVLQVDPDVAPRIGGPR
jgi:HEAT repeat protein